MHLHLRLIHMQPSTVLRDYIAPKIDRFEGSR